MIAWALLACGGPEAPGYPPPPEGAARLTFAGPEILLDGAAVAPVAALEREPAEGSHPALVEALQAAAGRSLRVELEPETPFWKLRQVLGSAREAGTGAVSVALPGPGAALDLPSPSRFGLAGSCDAPVPVSGAEPSITLSVQSGPEGSWVVAAATFLPVTDRGPVDGYPAGCLSVPTCDRLYPDGPLRVACEAGASEGAERRVRLSGEHGCLLSIAKEPAQAERWRAELAEVSRRLGLPERRLLVVMPEARIRADALVPALDGLRAAGVRAPVGVTPLVEGNDGPPPCTAEVRDRDALEAAGARWLGSLGRPRSPEGP